ncbi:MAG: response regulator [Pseudomonadota bacterium]
MKLLRGLTLSYRLFLLIAIFALGFAVFGASSFRTLDQLKVNGPLYGEIVASKDIIADALPPPLYIIESYLVCLRMAAPGAAAADIGKLEARLGQLRDEHGARKRHWAGQPLERDLAAMVDAVGAPAERFYALAFGRLLPALRAGREGEAKAALAAMAPVYEQHREAVDLLVARAAARAGAAETAAAGRIAAQTNTLLCILFASLGVAIGLAVLVRSSITVPLGEALEVAKRVAGGDMGPHAHARHPDEPGQLLEALDAMGASLAAMLAERGAAELSLRRAKELTERLIDSANVAIVGLDRAGRVRIFNHSASAMTGYPAPAVLGQVWRELAQLGDQHAARWPDAGGFGAVPASDEYELTTAAGARRCVAWRNTVLGDEGGEVALMSFGIDVTEQRAAFEATREAQELAEAATRSKSEFLANMSHEIRTPMNAVIGMTRLALDTELDARQRNYLEKVDRAAHGLLGIINDILDFSKIEAGKLRFERRPMLLRQTLDHLAGISALRAQQKGLELLFDIGPDVPLEMLGDPLRLGQVLLNLVNNAIKFTDRGEVIVSIRTEPGRADEVHLRFEVRDSGIGIRPEQAARLFESFAQADASTTRTHGGTGLGLAISRKLVELMDGRLWLESEYGSGSRFLFTARFGRQAWGGNHGAGGADLGALKVLVVDDNAAAREIMQAILASMQMRAVAALSGPAAIAELARAERAGEPYQLVLMDWIMPSMDGLAAIRAIRADPAISRTLAIIMVTAYSRDDLLAQAGDLHGLGVLDKPVTPSSVLDAIVDGMKGGALAAAPRALPQRRMGAALRTLRARRVLLVEDNEVNQELALDILNKLGLHVSVAGNGEVALRMLGEQAFDAVLMDCQMPVMDGFEATRQIRAQERFAGLPVLAMTANAMSGDRERCLAAGMNEHIAKPIDQDALALTLAQWLAPAGPPAAGVGAGAGLDLACAELRGAGIDVDHGLGRLHGDEVAYIKLMGQLKAAQAGFDAQLKDALAQGGAERARRLVHNLRGLADKLGAGELATAAARLEAAIAADTAVDEALVALAGPCARVLAAVDAQLGADAP